MCWTTEQRATKKTKAPAIKRGWTPLSQDPLAVEYTTNALDHRAQQRETEATTKPTKDHWVLITPLGGQKASQALIENTSLMSKPSSSRQTIGVNEMRSTSWMCCPYTRRLIFSCFLKVEDKEEELLEGGSTLGYCSKWVLGWQIGKVLYGCAC